MNGNEPLMKLELSESLGRGGTTCAYCRDHFESSAATNTCGHCMTVYHEDCVEELKGRCAIFGCQGSFEVEKPRLQMGSDTKVTRGPEVWGILFFLLGIPVALSSFFISYVGSIAAMFFGIAGMFISFGNAIQAITAMKCKDANSDKFLPHLHEDSMVCLRGIPEPQGSLLTPENEEALWFHTREQEFQRVGKSSKWITQRQEKHCLPFRLGKVTVSNQPTEVYSRDSKKTISDREGRFRRHTEWIKAKAETLVIGVLVRTPEGYLVREAPSVGLLFSVESAEAMVRQEGKKALFGVGLTVLSSIYLISKLFL